MSWVYGAIVRRRSREFDQGIRKQQQLDGIVISVGNLTVGGTGKTPMVLWLAQRLAAKREPVGILSRGYKGALRADENTAQRLKEEDPEIRFTTSDEVRLLSRRLGKGAKFGVGADRWAEGRRLEQAGIKYFLLDDGFQHRGLARDVDIVLIDSTDPFGGGRLLPAGRLREPLGALLRADILVITRTDSAPEIEATLRRFSNAPVFYAKTELEDVRLLDISRAPADRIAWLGRRAFAFCAIGNPDAFFADVRHWGMELAGAMAFRDHHKFTAADARRIEQAAQAAGAEILVCTEKDSFNLGTVQFSGLPVYSCDVTMRVAAAEEFWSCILDVIEQKRGGRPA
jgi:tetraacyldisaccharide 4'-kinase